MYKMKWADATGGGWLNDGEIFPTLADCDGVAQMAFAEGEVDGDAIIQAIEVDADGNEIPFGEFAEWDEADFDV